MERKKIDLLWKSVILKMETKNAWNISVEQTTKKKRFFFFRELDFLALVTLKRFYLELTVLKDSA